jgi:methanogenic corrinoid protein MtbC1
MGREYLMAGFTPPFQEADCWQDAEEECQEHLHSMKRLSKGNAGKQRQRLVNTIEGEIIPRLMMAHKAANSPPDAPYETALLPTGEDISDFTRHILSAREEAPLLFVDALMSRGITPGTLLLDLLTPCARRLGEMWEADLCDFSEVTIGLGRLQQLLRVLSPKFHNTIEAADAGPRILLSPMPGEQHTLGIFIVEEFFRRAGWSVWSGGFKSADELADLVKAEWFTMVGLSLACATKFGALAQTIRQVRRASKNKSVGIIVGGKVFLDDPGLVVRVGADATAYDAAQAVEQAGQMLGLALARRSSS